MLQRAAVCAWLGLLAVSVYGFFSRHLADQTIWQPSGVYRFLVFLGIVCTAAAIIIALRPQLIASATIAAVAIYTIWSVGILPPIATAFFLFACFVLGRLLFPVTDLLALLAGMSVFLWLTSFLTHFPVNYPATYLGIFGVVLAINPATTKTCALRIWKLSRPWKLSSRFESTMLVVALVPLLAHWLVALKPEISADGLSMHLVVPAYVAEHHRWSFDFRHFVWAVMPMGGVWGYTVTYLLGGEFAAKLLNVSLLAVICALLYQSAVRWVGRSTAFLLTALFAATPIVQLVTGSLFIENFYAALFMGALVALWEYHSAKLRPALLVSALLLGFALSVKMTALPFVIPALLVVIWEAWQVYRAGDRRWLVLCVLVVAIVAPAPYLYAWWMTGNPAFPFLNNLFRSPYFSQVFNPDPRFSEPLTWRTLFDLTFETHRYWEGQDGSAGFHLLWLCPLVLLKMRRQWRSVEWTLAGLAFAGLLAGLLLKPNLRYLYPAFPVMTLSLALIFRDLSPGFQNLLRANCIACLALNLWFLPSSSWYDKMFCLNPLDRHAAETYLAANAPARLLIDRLNRQYPGEPALFLTTTDIAGLRGEAWSDGWHSYELNQRIERQQNETDVAQLFRELGLRHFIYPNPAGGTLVREAQVRRYLADFTEPEEDRGTLRLAKLKSSPALPDDAQTSAAPPGEYDDFDARIRFRSHWSHDTQFASAAHHSLTYSDLPGASFRFEFRGSAVTWMYTKAMNRGIAEIYIDGVRREDVDLYSPAVAWQSRTVFGCPGPGVHTLEVHISGRHNAASSGAYVDVDELVVQ
ncbi:MAG TPA: glycosyltransferase family 39 protein [Bryobacteraceae bacterium]|nr:glycosyltransferase family 39 protein [Bryobacteraceae bacterium]